MGVVKNLMVRVGANVSSYVKGMRDASVSNMAFGKSSREAQTAVKGYESPFKAAARASAALKQEMAAVTKANDSAKERLSSVSQELGKAKNALEAVQAASTGLNMKKTFAEERAGIEAEIEAVNAKLGSLQQGMKGSQNGLVEFDDGFISMDDAKAQYASLTSESDALGQKLAALDEVADRLGSSFQTSTIKQALQEVQDQVDKLGAEYRATEGDMARTAERASHLGRVSPVAAAVSAALKAAGNNARSLGAKLSNIPALFGKISKSAKSSSDNVTRLLSDIKRIGVVSLGLRVAGGLFGKMKSMISSCMTSNAAYTESVNTMRYQLTQALAPAIGLVTSLLQTAMPVINGFASAFSRVLVAAFGKTEAAAYAASAAMAGTGTYGFDQITKVDSSAVSDTSVQGADMFSRVADKVAGEITKIKALIRSGDWSGIGGLLAGHLNRAVDKLGEVNLGEKLAGIINGAVQMGLAFLREFDWGELGAVIQDNFLGLWNGIDWGAFEPIADLTCDIFIGVLTEIVDLLKDLSDLLSGKINFSEFIGNLSAVQVALVAIATAVGLIKAASTGITIFAGLKELVTTGVIGKLAEVFAIAANGAGTLSEAINLVFGPGSVIAGVAALIGGIVMAGVNFFQMFNEGFSWLKEALMAVGIALAAVGAIILGAPVAVAAVVAAIVAAVATAVVLVKEHWAEICAWFSQLCKNIGSFFVNLWSGIVSGLKSAVNSVIGFINGLISSVVSGLNAVIGLLNKLSFDIPDWVPGLGGKTFGFNISALTAPKINYLAEGGYIVGPTEARLGEGGFKEVALPLERNTGWAKTVAELLNEESGAGSSTPMILQVFIGGKKVHEGTISYINAQTQATGVCPIRV